MNRRKALGSILGLTGVGIASYVGFKYVSGNSASNKEQLSNYLNLIAELVDVIIPPTETPGAKEAKVQEYIINYMENCASNKEYNNFYNGLNDLQETCSNKYNSSFEKCTMKQKIELLESLDNNSDSNSIFSKISNKISGRSFFNILKTLTIEGYCSSELGATEHLVYDPVPARYEAITTIKPNQKAWATR